MGFRAWAARCIPGFSILALSFLILLALTDVPQWYQACAEPDASWRAAFASKGTKLGLLDTTTPPEYVFAAYNLLIHILALLAPLRFCWSLWQITGQVRQVDARYTSGGRANSCRPGAWRRASSPATSTHLEESTNSGDDCQEKRGEGDGSLGRLRNAILLPSYKEEIENLRETLDVLASHHQAKSAYDIWLAMEEMDPTAKITANTLLESFADHFRSIQYTMHPAGLPGEVQGKSSNISWAASMAARSYMDLKSKRDCLITVMDADTHLSSNYFSELSSLHSEFSDTAETTIYAAPIIFDRNAHKVPPLVRLSDIVWCAAGISGLYPGSTIAIPTSVYSIPLSLAEMVGGWDTGAEAIGEDMHMYLKCYFALAGHLTMRTIYSPASQSNVSSDEPGLRGHTASLRARYRQAMRHMWGALDSGYAFKQAGSLIAGLPRTAGQDYFSSKPIARSFSRCTPKISLFMLAHRMFEAHILTVHLFVLLLASAIYQLFTPPEATPAPVLVSMNVAGILRATAFVTMLCAFYLYESYHAVCVRIREEEMRRAGLHDQMQGNFSAAGGRSIFHWAQYLLFPVAGILFVTIPSVVAQLSHFTTDRLEYEVSKKPKIGVVIIRGKMDVEKGVD